jgi:hypothetical protein
MQLLCLLVPVHEYQYFKENCCLYLQGRDRQQVTPKYLDLPTKLHKVTFQKASYHPLL